MSVRDIQAIDVHAHYGTKAYGEEGVAVNALGFTQDITERKHAEEEREEAYAFLQNIVE